MRCQSLTDAHRQSVAFRAELMGSAGFCWVLMGSGACDPDPFSNMDDNRSLIRIKSWIIWQETSDSEGSMFECDPDPDPSGSGSGSYSNMDPSQKLLQSFMKLVTWRWFNLISKFHTFWRSGSDLDSGSSSFSCFDPFWIRFKRNQVRIPQFGLTVFNFPTTRLY